MDIHCKDCGAMLGHLHRSGCPKLGDLTTGHAKDSWHPNKCIVCKGDKEICLNHSCGDAADFYRSSVLHQAEQDLR